jgi:hypothetical protein
MQQSKFAEHVGEENVLPNISAALDRAEEVFPAVEKEMRRRSEAMLVKASAT